MTEPPKTVKDQPPAMTAFTDKPLPPIRETRPKLPPLIHARNRHTDRTAKRPSSAATSNAPERMSTSKPKKESSKMSLFSLFSRPKVEKLRGYAEPGLNLPPMQEAVSRSLSPEPQKLVKQSREIPRQAATRPGTSMSTRESELPRRSRDGRSNTAEQPMRHPRRRSAWIPPPFFQAYAQSVKASKAQIADGTNTFQVTRRRRDSLEVMMRSDKPHRSGSVSSIQYSGLPKRIFALTRSGHLLQYAEQGYSERLPERVLQLTKDSVACACDLVPGERFVLQIAQSVDAMESGASSSVSLLSRMGLRGSLARKETSNILLVLRTAQEMDEWLVAVRKQIQILGGDAKQVGDRVAEGMEQEGHGESPKTQQAPVYRKQNLLNFPQRRVSVIVADSSEELASSSPQQEKVSADETEQAKQSKTLDTRKASTDNVRPAAEQKESRTKISIEIRPESRKGSNSSHAESPNTSPASDNTMEGSLSADQIRKQFPFKIRSSIPGAAPQPADGAPRISRNSFSCDPSVRTPTASQSEARPDSIVTDLPLIWTPKVLSRATTPTPSISKGIETKQIDPRLKPLRTSEPSNPRRPTTKPFALPLKVNTSVTMNEPTSKEPSNDESPDNKPESATSSSRHPRRSSSSKLSLFPTPVPAPQPATAPVRPTASPNDQRSLRRPSSLQVRSNPAPFLSSMRSSSATRPPLNKAESNSSLRSVSTGAMTAPSPTTNTGVKPIFPKRISSYDYKFNASTSDLAEVAFLRSRMGGTDSVPPSPIRRPVTSRDRSDDITALPPPRAASAQSMRPRTSSRVSGVRSPPLPALDLGIPVIGLAPPAPPPDRSLPSLPAPPKVPPKGVAAH